MTRAYLELHELKRLEQAAAHSRDRLLIRLLFRLGCRVSEALALEVRDIDFARGTVTITNLKTRTNLTVRNVTPRSGTVAKTLQCRRIRTRPLDKDTLEMLRDYIRRGGPVTKEGKALIFGIGRHRAWQIVKQYAAKAGLPKLTNPETGKVHNVSPHRLRDAFAVLAMKVDDSGDGLRLLQEHLGHASFNTTARYRKVAGEESKGWYNKLWPEEERSDGTEAH